MEEIQQVTPTQRCFSGNFRNEISYISISYALVRSDGGRIFSDFNGLQVSVKA
jgi:hypothetical protein